jgi:hypothetical protein
MLDGRHWANSFRAGSHDDEAAAIVDAVNMITTAGHANVASVVLACSQMLAQTIAHAGPEIAPEVRAAILTLIDDYAMRYAVEPP